SAHPRHVLHLIRPPHAQRTSGTKQTPVTTIARMSLSLSPTSDNSTPPTASSTWLRRSAPTADLVPASSASSENTLKPRLDAADSGSRGPAGAIANRSQD